MHLANMDIERIIIHQIFQRDEDGKKVKPLQSHAFTRFDNSAMDEFKSRVREALGDDSKAVQMEIVNQGPKDLISIIDTISTQTDEDFAVSSYDIADKLTDAQYSRSMSGGIIVIFQGKQGHPPTEFIGILKAEIHSAYQKKTNSKTKEISLEFVKDVLLTPSQKLFKTVAFFRNATLNKTTDGSKDLNGKWRVMISDFQISKADGKASAQYFYSSFAGCGYPETSARTTKQFFEATKSYIGDLETTVEDKYDLFNALTTYLKVDTSSSISASDFAKKYFDDVDIQDDYVSYIKNCDLPVTSFTKDVEHIKSKLKTRKINFKGQIRLTAPSDAFVDLVSIEAIEGQKDESGHVKEWTKIIVKDSVNSLE